MRLLKEQERTVVFDKISKYIKDIDLLIKRSDENFAFFYHRDRVFYTKQSLSRHASTVVRKHLLSFGTCFGKFTKSNIFRLHITALDFLSPYARYRVWVKNSAEQQFLYGQHILKSGVARITEDTPQYAGVIVMNMQDTPVGFGATAKSALDLKNSDPMTIVVFHQADIGEYIRSEDTIV